MNWKNWTILKPLKDLYNSLFNNDQGFSFRKASAVFSLFTAFKMSFTITDEKMKMYVTFGWIVFAAVCIGLVTIPDLIKFLNKDNTQAS